MMNMGILKKIACYIIYKCIRIRKGVFVFSSFEGHYSDNPKYISIELNKSKPEIKQVWLLKKEYFGTAPDYVTKVEIDSLAAYYWKGRAEVLVDNVYGDREIYIREDNTQNHLKYKIISFLTSKKNQPLITNFHGSAFKYAGRDLAGSNQQGFICPDTYLLLSNDFSCKIYEHLTFGNIPIRLLGYPRNDILFDESIDKARLKAKLGINPEKRVVLFAPTFRSDSKDGLSKKNIERSGLNQLKSLDLPVLFRVLNEKFGGEWTLVCRFHYHVEELIDWELLSKEHKDKVVRGNIGDDMAEYLAISDILLTDASSSMFDYAVTNKPCILYFTDWKEYGSKERGFYIPIKDLPFPLAENFTELITILSDWDSVVYESKIADMKSNLGYVDDGNASQRNVQYILEKRWINAKTGYKKME